MSDLNKLKTMLASKKTSKGNKIKYDSSNPLVVAYLGVEPREHFPKLETGERSKVSDGWTFTFSEIGTSKIVKIVLKNKVSPDLLSVYQLAGMGYDIKQSSMIFIDEDTKIATY